MKQRKIKYLKAYNILCFGSKGIELNFENLGNIVLVKGKNLDAVDDENDAKDASNGAGKSTIADIISYVLFGKTIKKAKKFNQADVIHNQADKNGLYVEIIIDDYRIVRTRKLRKNSDYGSVDIWYSPEGIWDEDTRITQVKKGTIQDKIERDIIGLNYETFVNIFVFGDDNSTSFLECDAPTKREIVENLLSLERYRSYHSNAKDFVKDVKDNIKSLTKDYEKTSVEFEACKTRISKIESQEEDWKKKKQDEINKLIDKVKSIEYKINNTDYKINLVKYQESQESISKLNISLTDYETKKVRLLDIIKNLEQKFNTSKEDFVKINDKINELNPLIKKYKLQIEENKKIISDGGKCPTCKKTVDNRDELIQSADQRIQEINLLLETATTDKEVFVLNLTEISQLKQKSEKILIEANDKLSFLNKEISNTYLKINELSKIKEPSIKLEEALLNEQLESAKIQLSNKENETNPFQSILNFAKEELAIKETEHIAKKEEIAKAEKDLPYYEFWVKAFGDNGIRKYIIDGIIPVLNSRIAYWLYCLMNGKIKLTFDSSLTETIDRYPFDGKKYAYHGLSNGQRRRLILALSQSFAYVMMVSSGVSLSTIFLDEVTMNMDRVGIESIYKMICELAKEKQVFIIDHNENLLRLLTGCEALHLQMQDGVTEVVNSF